MSSYKYIKWFEEISKDDVGLVGGKGANLGELTSFGLPVPPGFCVTAQAYNEFVEYADLQNEVKNIMSTLNVDDTKKLTEAGEQIRGKLTNAKIKPEIEEEIIRAYREFKEKVGVEDLEFTTEKNKTSITLM